MHKALARAALAAALTVTGVVASPASATSAAYCNPGTGQGGLDGVTGSILYLPAVVSNTVPVNSTWKVDVTLVCTVGAAPATGTYHLVIQGTSSEICATGGGGGSVGSQSAKTAGAGTGSVVNGSWQYARYGIHYYGYPGSGDGDILVQESPVTYHHYKVYMWLDLLPSVDSGPDCPGNGGKLTGHATITEP